MPRYLKVAAAQMGPNQEGTPREAIVDTALLAYRAAHHPPGPPTRRRSTPR